MGRSRDGRIGAWGARWLALSILTLTVGCGSGGGGDEAGAPAAQPLSSTEQASRFAAQATLGADMEEIARIEALGFEVWLDEQLALPPSSHLGELQRLVATYADPANPNLLRSPYFRQLAWWSRVMGAPDLLRQRVAMALSEIFVVSDRADLLAIAPESVASYYDVLLEHAFGSYEALLLDVTLHPAMGVYLSHLNNDRSDPVVGRFPDENYAREVMQLFSIGLYELEPDGSVRVDVGGDPIPTYGNAEITELAKVFTGLGLQGPLASFGGQLGDRRLPMVMYEDHHEPGPKTLLRGFVIPGGQPGMQDVEDAVAHLADHPNVGPFLARRLIQRLVKSNPSPAYVARVAAVFDDDGGGARGQLGAVVRAILLDEEARRDPGDETDGFLREPFLRFVSMLRTFDARAASGEYLIQGAIVGFLLGQHPMSSPSVFNFFQPDFAPSGPIARAGLVAPEFQVTTDASVLWIANLATYFLFEQPAFPVDVSLLRPGSIEEEDVVLAFDFSDEIAVAGDIDALLDRLDLLLTYGTMSSGTRQTIARVLEDPMLVDPELRVRVAVHFILMSPDYSVVR
jgi:uncharacterized protein (DUF1800 family)